MGGNGGLLASDKGEEADLLPPFSEGGRGRGRSPPLVSSILRGERRGVLS